jgi:hypothetical protein
MDTAVNVEIEKQGASTLHGNTAHLMVVEELDNIVGVKACVA